MWCPIRNQLLIRVDFVLDDVNVGALRSLFFSSIPFPYASRFCGLYSLIALVCGGVGYFDTREQCFFTKNDEIEVVWQARGSVFFRTSHEEWGKERNLTQASILFADCQTYDEDGDKTDKYFSTKELEKYLQP